MKLINILSEHLNSRSIFGKVLMVYIFAIAVSIIPISLWFQLAEVNVSEIGSIYSKIGGLDPILVYKLLHSFNYFGYAVVFSCVVYASHIRGTISYFKVCIYSLLIMVAIIIGLIFGGYYFEKKTNNAQSESRIDN